MNTTNQTVDTDPDPLIFTEDIPRKRAFLFTLLFSFILCFGALPFLDLTSGDETRVAGISAEMQITGDYVVSRLNGTPFLEYPPCYYWAESACFNLLGRNYFAAALPSAVCAFLSCLVIFLLAVELKYKNRTALMSAVMLLTGLQFLTYAHTCMVDAMLAFFILLTWYGFAAFLNHEKKGERIGFFSLSVLGLCGGIMTKGPAGLALPLSGIGIWLIADDVEERRLHFIRYVQLGTVFLCALIPVLIWGYLLYLRTGWEGVYAVIGINGLGRFSGEQGDHLVSWTYYWLKLPGLFQPWLIFLLLAFVSIVRNWKKKAERREILYPLLILVVPFILLNFSAAKRQVYLLPLYAPCALLSARFLCEKVLPGVRSTYHVRKYAKIIGITLFAVAAILIFVSGFLMCWAALSLCYPFAAIFGACYAIRNWAFRRKDYAIHVILSVTCFILTVQIALSGYLMKIESVAPLYRDAVKLESGGNRIYMITNDERTLGASYFYMGKKAEIKYVDVKDSASPELLPPPGEYWITRRRDVKYKHGKEFSDYHWLIPAPPEENGKGMKK